MVLEDHGVLRMKGNAVRAAGCVAMAALCLLIARTARSADAPGDRGFREQVDKFLEEEMRLYPERATGWGDHRYDAKLSDLSQPGIATRIAHAEKWQRTFGAIEPKSLSTGAEADREWLVARCDGQLLRLQEIRTWEQDPGMYLPTGAVHELVERNFAPAADRMRSVTARERAAIANFSAARVNLKPGTTPKVEIDIALQQMAGTMGFFRKDLPEAFAAVPRGMASTEFDAANAAVLAAIAEFEVWLKDQLLPAAKGQYAIGTHAYVRMLRDDDMVDLPLTAVEAVGVKELARLQQAFTATAKQIDPNHSAAEVLATLTAQHPAADQVIAQASAGLESIRSYVVDHHIATIPSQARPTVAETPPYARATTFASMDSPGPFEKSPEAYFYVTLPEPSWPPRKQEQQLVFFAPPMLSDVSVHEVYPGHYVQFLNNRLNPDEVRTLYYSGANAEGWGLYCEQMMLDEGLHGGDPRYRLAQLQMALQRACRYLVGIRMHTQTMTVEQAEQFFEHNGYMTEHNSMVEALRGTEDPGYLRYQLGKLMILKLREDLKKKEGASFEIGKFHDEFLKQGAMPLKLIRRAMLGEDEPLL